MAAPVFIQASNGGELEFVSTTTTLTGVSGSFASSVTAGSTIVVVINKRSSGLRDYTVEARFDAGSWLPLTEQADSYDVTSSGNGRVRIYTLINAAGGVCEVRCTPSFQGGVIHFGIAMEFGASTVATALTDIKSAAADVVDSQYPARSASTTMPANSTAVGSISLDFAGNITGGTSPLTIVALGDSNNQAVGYAQFATETAGFIGYYTEAGTNRSNDTAMIVLEAPAAGQYVPVAVDFDGTNDYLTRGADLTGNADGKQGTLSVWLKLGAGTDGMWKEVLGAWGDRFRVQRRNTNKLSVQAFSATGSLVLDLHSSTSVTAASGWVHLVASWDVATSTAHLYINGVEDKNVLFITDNTIDYTLTQWVVGSNSLASSSLHWNGAMADLYLNTAEYVDLSISANRAKFFDAGPVDLGSDGSTPTGSQPAIWLHNPLATWHTNAGAGGGFTLNGALTESATAPGPIIDTTLAATGAATAAVSSTLTSAIHFAVAGTATASAAAAMSSAIHLAAAADGNAAAAADLTTAIALSSTATLTADATAGLTSTITLSAAGVATAAAAGDITTAIGLAASLAGSVAGAGDLSTAITLSASSAGTVAVLADMEAGTGLAAQAMAAAMISAELATAIPLSAEVAASATASASLDAGQAISATGAATATVTANLTTAIPLAAAGVATGTVSAVLTTELRLAATAAATLSAAAALSTQIPLEATGTATAVAQASLEGGVGLAAQASATVSSQAALLTGIALQATGDASVVALADLLTGLGLGDITDPGVISVTPWRDFRSVTPVRATVPV